MQYAVYNYTTEMLAVVETLKKFNYILHGQQIQIFTDHHDWAY